MFSLNSCRFSTNQFVYHFSIYYHALLMKFVRNTQPHHRNIEEENSTDTIRCIPFKSRADHEFFEPKT
ncbi:hypothetical protein BRADI_4g00889v3 [Brachypodium distachyon]|uniref:Uncharacterized protein n=1 Tax=Brachypodium distachyon TaxID=15368 RepID=A0A0Q3EDC7_BRADI|nr:hypothetical protein BRADI_4g00889v3 [Brachypodium distachyon]